MEDLREKARSWIEKFQETTNLIANLDDDTTLPNGWTIREISIHFKGWDEEFIKFAEQIKQGEPYYAFYSGKHDRYNQTFFDKNHNLSLKQAKESFINTRKKIIEVYEDVLDYYFQDDKKILGFFSLWWHDTHHLKQAGVDVEHLME